MTRTALVLPIVATLLPFAAAQSTSFGNQQVISYLANGASDVCAADLDGDGDLDVLWASRFNDEIGWHENLGGSFGPEQIVTSNADDVRHVIAADLDGDGDLDVLSASLLDDRVAWYENLGGVTTSTATSYGAGCGSPPMTMTPTSTAVATQAMTATVSDTPTPLCVIAMGLSDAAMPGLGPLPFDLSPIGMTGCTLYQSAEVFGLGTTLSGQAFTTNWSYPVPGGLSAVGLHIYTQAFSYAPGSNQLQVVASNGIDWLIGDQ